MSTWAYIHWVLLCIAIIFSQVITQHDGDGDSLPRTTHEVYELNHSHVLDCYLPEASVSDYEWFINGAKVGQHDDTAGVRLEQGGRVLRLPSAGEDRFGDYSCNVGNMVARKWRLEARPHATVAARTDVLEGDTFVITCELVGKPYAAVSWNYTAEGSNASVALPVGEGSRFRVRDSPAGVPAGLLEGSDAARADAGLYTCVAPRAGQPASSTLRVRLRPPRVHEPTPPAERTPTSSPPTPSLPTPSPPTPSPPSPKPSALWPFLGICLEVLVVCAIILAYERHRAKP